MASGGSLPLRTGSFVGTGAEIAVEVGYRPKVVRLINLDDPAEGVHVDTMADGEMLAGTDTFAKVAAGGITLTDTGFTVGADANFNTAGEQVHWVAQG